MGVHKEPLSCKRNLLECEKILDTFVHMILVVAVIALTAQAYKRLIFT